MSQSHVIPRATSALLVMDFQNILLDNYLSTDTAADVLARTSALVAAARDNEVPVIYVMVGFRDGHPEVSPRNSLFSAVKQHGAFVLGASSTAIHPAIAPMRHDAVVVKHRIGAFSGTDLDTLLQARGVETLVLAGITTSGVVLSTVRQAFDRDYRVIVPDDCCADSDPEIHRFLIERVISAHAEVVSAQDVIASLA